MKLNENVFNNSSIRKENVVPQEHYTNHSYIEENEFTKFIQKNWNLFWATTEEIDYSMSPRTGKDSFDVTLWNTKFGKKTIIECKVRSYALFQFTPKCMKKKKEYLETEENQKLIFLNKYKLCQDNMMKGFIIEEKKYNNMMKVQSDLRLYMNFFDCGNCTLNNIEKIKYNWVEDYYQKNNWYKNETVVAKIVHYITAEETKIYKYI